MELCVDCGPLKLQYLIDPVFELRNSRVHAWLIWLGTTNTPRYDTGQQPSFVGPLDYHRTTGIALNVHFIYYPSQTVLKIIINTHFTRIETAFFPSRTNKYVRYMFNIPSCTVHSFTNRVVNYRNRYFLKNTW